MNSDEFETGIKKTTTKNKQPFVKSQNVIITVDLLLKTVLAKNSLTSSHLAIS